MYVSGPSKPNSPIFILFLAAAAHIQYFYQRFKLNNFPNFLDEIGRCPIILKLIQNLYLFHVLFFRNFTRIT